MSKFLLKPEFRCNILSLYLKKENRQKISPDPFIVLCWIYKLFCWYSQQPQQQQKKTHLDMFELNINNNNNNVKYVKKKPELQRL